MRARKIEVELLQARREKSKIPSSARVVTTSPSVYSKTNFKLRHPELKIAATNVGSLGGLLALQRGETHIAGTHLLDPETGVYNIPDIKKTIPNTPVVLVHLAQREQGILVLQVIRNRFAACTISRERIAGLLIGNRVPGRASCWITSSRD